MYCVAPGAKNPNRAYKIDGQPLTVLANFNLASTSFMRPKPTNDPATALFQMNCSIVRATVTKATRQAKREFFMREARAGSKFFWRHIKQATSFGKCKTCARLWPCNDAATSRPHWLNMAVDESLCRPFKQSLH